MTKRIPKNITIIANGKILLLATVIVGSHACQGDRQIRQDFSEHGSKVHHAMLSGRTSLAAATAFSLTGNSAELSQSEGGLVASSPFYETLKAQSPQFRESEANNSCNGENPGHDDLATGVLRQNFSKFLKYNSSSTSDFGMGSGIQLANLTTAFLMHNESGDRVIVKVGGVVSKMLPLENYQGNFGYWPKHSAAVATLDNNVLVISYSDFHRNEFHKLAESNTFVLRANYAPNRVVRYEYNDFGLARIWSENSCDNDLEFSYDNGRLDRVTQSRANGSETTSFVYQDGVLAGFTIAQNGISQIGEIPLSTSYQVKWHPSGLLAGIYDAEDNLLEGYSYEQYRLKNIITPDETTIFAYDAISTTVRSSLLNLENIVYFDHCHSTHSAMGGAVSTRSLINVEATDVENLDLSTIESTVSSEGNQTLFRYQEQGLLASYSVLGTTGTQIISESYGYDASGRSISTTLVSKAGSLTSTTTYQFGLPVKIVAPTGQEERRYDGEGNLIEHTKGGITRQFLYDSRGLLMSRKNLATNFATLYTYDDKCQVTSVETPFSKKSFEYTADGRVSKLETTGLETSTSIISYQDEQGYTTVQKSQSGSMSTVQKDFWGNVLNSSINGQVNYDYQASAVETTEDDYPDTNPMP